MSHLIKAETAIDTLCNGYGDCAATVSKYRDKRQKENKTKTDIETDTSDRKAREVAAVNTPESNASQFMSHVKLRRQAQGRRRYVRHGGTLCSACLAAPPAPSDGYCRPCRAARRRALRAKRATR